MKQTARFLHSLANLISTGALYGPEHPTVARGLEACHRELSTLLETQETAPFSFLEDEVVYGDEPLREMKNWPWCRRFADAGVQRLEFERGVEKREIEGFLAGLAGRLEMAADAFQPGPHPHIRHGQIGVKGAAAWADPAELVAAGSRLHGTPDAPSLELEEETEALEWIHQSARDRGEVPISETAAVVRALTVAMHDVKQLIAPLVELKFTDQYTTAHCINVSILSMALAEYLKFSDSEVRAIGEAALLHDIGKTRVPLSVTNKPGKLTPEERTAIEQHPVEGARILLRGEKWHALAAVIAYEHHMHWNREGGGYPARTYRRRPHRFSRLVQVCDVYDALRTRRPFRPPFSPAAALEFLSQRAGSEFDPAMVTAFTDMVRQWDPPTLEHEAAGEDGTEDEGREVELGTEDLSLMPDTPFDADTEDASVSAS